MSQSSMEMEIPSQKNSQEDDNRVTEPKLAERLQKALDKFNDKFTQVNVPKNESDWEKFLKESLLMSDKCLISYEEHLWRWIQLIITAETCKKSTYENSVLMTYMHGISTLPLKIRGAKTDTTWLLLISGIYHQIMENSISEDSGRLILAVAEKRFKHSPKHAKLFWDTIVECEKQLCKHMKSPPEVEIRRITDIYLRRFIRPYLFMEEDFDEFLKWSSGGKLSDDDLTKVRQSYLDTTERNKREIQLMTQILNDPDPVYTHEISILFETWIDLLCIEDNYNFGRCETLCEEMIQEEPSSIFTYCVFINFLMKEKFERNKTRKDKMINIIERGLRLADVTNNDMVYVFLEHCFIAASKVFSKDLSKLKGLIETAMTMFPITADIRKWYAVSRGIIIATSNLIHTGDLRPSYFEKHFKKVISPCQMTFFSDGPEESVDRTDLEIHMVELIRLWVTVQEHFYSWSNETTIGKWTDLFYNNKNPVVLVGYVDFVKCRGTIDQALEASAFAVNQVQAALLKESESLNPSTRRCYFKLLKDHLELLSAAGNADVQFKESRSLLLRIKERNPTEYCDIISPGSHIKGFFPEPSTAAQEVRERIPSTSFNFPDRAILNRFESLKVESDGSELDVTDERDLFKNTFKVFVSNLHYKAKEEDLMHAFGKLGFNPIAIDIQLNVEGRSRGIAHVGFDTKEAADQAVKMCNGFNVFGRPTYVSPFKSGPTYSSRGPLPNKPTLLNISNLDADWKDKDKIAKKLACYGHIKNLDILEREDSSFNVKVQFYMPEDAEVVYEKIIECKILGNDVKCRLGFAPKEDRGIVGKDRGWPKKRLPGQTRDKTTKTANLRTNEEVAESTNSVGDEQIGPQIPSGSFKVNPLPRPLNTIPTPIRPSFIPTQALRPNFSQRPQMKPKLYVGKTLASPNSSNSLKVSPRKRMKMSPETQSGSSITSSASAHEGPAQATNADMHGDADSGGSKRRLTNKDFQSLFKKDT